jgi:uncharacterized membrane protein YphA (DoxX/SURF4 family)
MNIVLWILQILLAIAFVGHGWLFVAPPAEMVAEMNAAYAPALRIFIGVAELLGTAGLILPGLTRRMPQLTVAAAAGLAVIVVSATIYHLIRGEVTNAATTAILSLLLLFVAYIRWKRIAATPATDAESSQRLTAGS